MSSDIHERARARSVALHRAVLDELRAHPELIERARSRVRDWAQTGSVAKPYIDAWRELLELPIDELEARITGSDDEAHDLRQVSPFAGILDPRTRWRILREVSAGREPRA